MLGIICAMKEELEPIHQHSSWNLRSFGRRPFLLGELRKVPVVATVSGIGKVAAATAATILIHRFQARTLLVVGTCGSFQPDLKIADVIIASMSTQFDYGGFDEKLQPYPGIPGSLPREGTELMRREVPFLALEQLKKKMKIPSDGTTHVLGNRVHVGGIATSDRFISAEMRKAWLNQNLLPREFLGVDMETDAIAQVCAEASLSWNIIKGVSDLLEDQDASSSFAENLFQANRAAWEIAYETIPLLL